MHTTGPAAGSPPFPATGTFRVRIVSTGELCAVTAVSGNDFTITRQDGGSSLSGTVLAGASIEQVLTKEALAAAFARADQATAGTLQAQGFQASGLGQFSTPGRFLGVLSVQGPPTSGTYQLGDYGFDSKGAQWYCSVAGTPGTWLYVGGGPYHAYAYATSSQALSNGLLINVNATDYDPNSNFNTGTHLYTCPVPGVYSAKFALESDTNGTLLASVRQAGGRAQSYFAGTTFNQAGNRPISAGATDIKAAAGDTIGLYCEVISVAANVGDINTLGKNFLAVKLIGS